MNSKTKLDVFISYPWAIKHYVDNLFAFLISNKFNVWMDRTKLNAGNALCKEIHKAIKAAKVFICCISREYLNSDMCNKEIQHAFDLKKTIIPIMFEDLRIEQHHVGLIIGGLLQIRVYDNPHGWNGKNGKDLISSLNKILDKPYSYDDLDEDSDDDIEVSYASLPKSNQHHKPTQQIVPANNNDLYNYTYVQPQPVVNMVANPMPTQQYQVIQIKNNSEYFYF